MDKVLEYLEIEENNPLGASKYAPLIIMINNKLHIVPELLDKDFIHYNNLWSFLDSVICRTREDREIIEHIIFVLAKFNTLEDKWNITGEDFAKIIKEWL